MSAAPLITKADGTTETFDAHKLLRSLRRSGADEATARDITAHIEAELSDGMTTSSIYRHARSMLKKRETVTAARYSLRRALFNLGPTGFPFEHFLARLFEADGYETKTGIIAAGMCVEHEIDLVATKPGDCFIAEAKFHGNPGVISDLQVALYSHARFQDLAESSVLSAAQCTTRSSYIITNTKFSKSAITYAECVGMRLLSWNYPRERTLQNVIEAAGIYPVTTLPSISNKDKRLLLEHGLVLCKDMAGKRDAMRELGLSPKKIETIVTESAALCSVPVPNAAHD